jgi:hypothetical protein
LPTQAVAQSQWSLEYPNLANSYLNEKFLNFVEFTIVLVATEIGLLLN